MAKKTGTIGDAGFIGWVIGLSGASFLFSMCVYAECGDPTSGGGGVVCSKWPRHLLQTRKRLVSKTKKHKEKKKRSSLSFAFGFTRFNFVCVRGSRRGRQRMGLRRLPGCGQSGLSG